VRRFPPERIVCLTEETVETLYLLGEEDRIVGVSGYAVRPPRVRREKPRVSAFTSADTTKILALAPDLVLASPISRPGSSRTSPALVSPSICSTSVTWPASSQ
jgi:ABC-type Fe3+-hydroxamate transport system substrate-binding protein